jgi:hypothetical protein
VAGRLAGAALRRTFPHEATNRYADLLDELTRSVDQLSLAACGLAPHSRPLPVLTGRRRPAAVARGGLGLGVAGGRLTDDERCDGS